MFLLDWHFWMFAFGIACVVYADSQDKTDQDDYS